MKSEILTFDDLKVLKAPFPRESLGVKVQSTSKDKTRALLVLYLQHTDVQDRLEQVDPAWTTEVLKEERVGDTVSVRIRMMVKGVARENVGEGSDPKGAYSDALKRCAMLFGVGRYLYDSPTVWADYNEQRDRFRQWTIDDYERAAKGCSGKSIQAAATSTSASAEAPASGSTKREAPAVSVAPKAKASATGNGTRVSSGAGPGPGLTTAPAPAKSGKAASSAAPATDSAAGGKEPREKKSGRTREQLNRVLMNLYRPYLTRFPETRFMELLQARYNVGETRMMTLEQIEDLVQFMEQQLAKAA